MAKAGRPTHGATAKRSPLGLRVDETLRAAIQEAADLNQRSMTQEIEDRLRQTLKADGEVGGVEAARFLRLVGIVLEEIAAKTGQSWMDDPASFMIAQESINWIMRRFGTPADLPELTIALMPSDDAAEREARVNAYGDRTRELYRQGDDFAERVIAREAPDLLSRAVPTRRVS